MQLTKFTDYGLRTLMYLAQTPNERASVKDISEYYGISRNHLVKVVHKLAQLKYITSTKGKGGGLSLNPQTLKLTLADIVLELEPDMNIVECFNKLTNTCRITDTCMLKHRLYEAQQSFIDTLHKSTLEDIINKS